MWIPHNLTQVQGQNRVAIARKLLRKYEIEGDNCIDSIVAIDQTWIQSYEPELNLKGHTPNSPSKNQGVLLSHRVPTDETVSAVYYETFLGEHLKRTVTRDRPNIMAVRPKILHDNAACHTCDVISGL